RRLWRGETLLAKAGDGREIPVEIFPKPVQPELPIWLATGGNPETFVEAGKIGANVLTALLLLDVEELGNRVKLFRQSLSQHDHDPGCGKVTVMLHTYIGDDLEAVRQTVKGPFLDYLRSHVDLLRPMAAGRDVHLGEGDLSSDDREALLSYT